MLPKQTRPAWREVWRFHATELKREGWTYDEIADALAVSKAAISKWMKLISRHGDAGLRAHPRKGASPRLTPAQLRLLPGLLAEGTPAYGFRGEVWTCERIARVIEWEFGVSHHKAHVSRPPKAISWTPQRPAERATQRNEAAIYGWRSEVWPALKKNPARGAPHRLCR